MPFVRFWEAMSSITCSNSRWPPIESLKCACNLIWSPPVTLGILPACLSMCCNLMLSGTLSADEIRLSSVMSLRNTANQMASEVFNTLLQRHCGNSAFFPKVKIKIHYSLIIMYQTCMVFIFSVGHKIRFVFNEFLHSSWHTMRSEGIEMFII